MAGRVETMVGGFKKIGADVGCDVGIFYDRATLTFGVWTFSERCQDLGCCLDRRVTPNAEPRKPRQVVQASEIA